MINLIVFRWKCNFLARFFNTSIRTEPEKSSIRPKINTIFVLKISNKNIKIRMEIPSSVKHSIKTLKWIYILWVIRISKWNWLMPERCPLEMIWLLYTFRLRGSTWWGKLKTHMVISHPTDAFCVDDNQCLCLPSHFHSSNFLR